MVKNLYDVLGVVQNATTDQIRNRFRELARLRHPDRFQGVEKDRAERDFQEITSAFNVLSDPERRRGHDIELSRLARERQSADASSLFKTYMQRGSKAYKDGNYIEAADNFDRATKEQKDNAKAWHHLALACSHQRRWLSRATAAIVQACEIEPMNVNYLKLAGRLFESAGVLTRAEQFYAESLKWGGADPAVEERLEEIRRQIKKSRSGFFGKVV